MTFKKSCSAKILNSLLCLVSFVAALRRGILCLFDNHHWTLYHYATIIDTPKYQRTSRLLQQARLVSGAFKNRQHAAWPALFRKAHTDLEDLGGITCPAEWRPRHSVAEFLNKGVGYQPGLLLVR